MLKHELKPAHGANKERKRLGRGTGSGLGTTAGKGHKGQKARSGGILTPGFEGGQMPMSRRIPKRGFSNARFATVYEVVNLNSIQDCFENGAEVNLKTLKSAGLIHGNKDGVKVLGDGTLEKKLTFNVHKVSESAKEKIKKAGGSIKLIPLFAEGSVKPEKGPGKTVTRVNKAKARKAKAK